MKIIVSKFGGSSTANARNLERIRGIVHASPDRRWIVLSAPGIDERHPEKLTAMLERCWEQRKDGRSFDKALSRVTERLLEISDALGIEGMARLFRDTLESAAAVSLPFMLSRGEYLCARIFSRYSGYPMVDAAQLIAFDADGRLDEPDTRRRLRQLKWDGPVVVPGFYGADSTGRVHILPRNGSDITGALVAEGVEAGLYENWTDVPGLMTADPIVVPRARLIRHVSYRQMRSLSRAGARVLHPACLDPVAMAGIPTRLRSTWRPECFGTLIDEHCQRIAPAIAGRCEADRARISVFAPSPEAVLPAVKEISGSDARILGDCVLVQVERSEYVQVSRRLHRRLIEAAASKEA